MTTCCSLTNRVSALHLFTETSPEAASSYRVTKSIWSARQHIYLQKCHVWIIAHVPNISVVGAWPDHARLRATSRICACVVAMVLGYLLAKTSCPAMMSDRYPDKPLRLLLQLRWQAVVAAKQNCYEVLFCMHEDLLRWIVSDSFVNLSHRAVPPSLK